MFEIREERAGDIAAIRELNRVAFGQDQEGNIVDALRANGAVTLSLVATLNARVVGHPNFYRRVGFKPASTHGITCDWELPDDVFMVLILDPTLMTGVSGLAKYRSEFSSAS